MTEGLQVRLRSFQLGPELGDEAGLVVLPAVELALKPVPALSEGGVLLAGGDKGDDALFQLCRLVHGHAGLTNEGAALKDLPGHTGEDLAAAQGRQVGDRLSGAGIDGPEGPHGGVGSLGVPGDGDVPPLGR